MRLVFITLLMPIALMPGGISVAQETPAAPKSGQSAAKVDTAATEITFDDLKFEIAKDAKFDRKLLGEKIESLNGKQVKVTGYILPTSVFMREGIKTFILQYKNLGVNDPPPKMHQVIRVEMSGDKTTNFTVQPIAIEGEFSVKEWAVINGHPAAVYHLKATSVTPQQIDPVKK